MQRGMFLPIMVTATQILSAGVSLVEETRPILTLEMANAIADGCEAEQKKKGWSPLSIAIFDNSGNLVLFRRQDDSISISVEVSQLKGRTSAMLPLSTREIGDRQYADPNRPFGLQHVPGVVVFPGGLPIRTANNYHIGGVGVAGDTGDNDEKCAQAGLDNLAKMTKSD